MKAYRILIVLLSFIFMFCLIDIQSLYAQDKFMLLQNEMPDGYELSQLWDNYWAVGKDSLYKVKEQIWFKGNNSLLIAYCQFENEASGLMGTDYYSKSLSAVFRWGALDGSITGDLCWSDWDINSCALIYTKGNLGIQLVGQSTHRKEMMSIAEIILNKIETNLDEEVKLYESALKEKQIPELSFDNITNTLVQSDLKNYGFGEKWDSKWIVGQEEIRMGIRKTWKNEDSSVVVIDLCKFDTEQFAKSASEIRALYGPSVWNGNSSSYEYYNLDSVEEVSLRVKSIISQDSSMNVKTTSYSFVGSKGNIAVHVHFYNPKGINADTVYSVVKTLAGDIINF